MRTLATICLLSLALVGCKEKTDDTPDPEPSPTSEVIPVDVSEEGFELLEKMQGHWVGSMLILGTEYDWFAFDYRAISPSHVFGIYESGSAGNLLTSFFVTTFKGKKTIMARNGGLLNGIYRTSYFVLDSVSREPDGDFYRLVDAVGGKAVMWMELKFSNDQLRFNAYTSRLGLLDKPSTHMAFNASKRLPELSQTAAKDVGFPENITAWDFDARFREDYLYVNPGDEAAKSASYLDQDESKTVFDLAYTSGDPIRIDEHPHLGYLNLKLELNDQIDQSTLLVYLSTEPLTDENGYMLVEPFDNVLHFPELLPGQNEFLFTYLHPGSYYVTVVADVNNDAYASLGDITHVSVPITVEAEKQTDLTIDNITVQN